MYQYDNTPLFCFTALRIFIRCHVGLKPKLSTRNILSYHSYFHGSGARVSAPRVTLHRCCYSVPQMFTGKTPNYT